RILRGLAGVAAGVEPSADPVADVLRRGWGAEGDCDLEVVRSALVLCADHELNASAFTCRCVASAGGSPYAAVTAALSALQGFKHGGHTELAASQLDAVIGGAAPRTLLSDALRQGRTASGFGHPLYPNGDPRARALLDLVRIHRPYAPAWDAAQRTIEAGREVLGEEPNLDLGLAVAARAIDLPAHAPFALFALGRTVGWIAHALEQYGTDRMIRPRARYVGPEPEAAV
ncbi:MAG: citrate synthase, partial [Planctomycetota bacterium]